MAYTDAKFALNAVLRTLILERRGGCRHTHVCREPAVHHGIDFFLSNIELGANGVEKIFPLGELLSEEQKLLEACMPDLKKNTEKGKTSGISPTRW
ncbi:hypothetical protein SCLCIDRAFT_27632 [Scleroderma citrinum Foug A]|uniref:Lactate/malate dehydrogenase C-terminal domain-containing protein n=1 Tax=Scleroderma citrinum Foug A TaxID=1036808 RepID=A0A0C3DSY5_9AGAM|nr:hypothetical protein SCLCIDRAFT_27632 [Scleroderma citrinum Foug A]